ncbi:hypothetical protein M9980_03580 [Sphingomonas donggukensis]|uniref:DUF4136 domain-containing protein n=1 Tax=Sphingomonas donggukensis TaxID=2949093 RepID=A0ABY4TWS4_9SPHN|nr:hypothetical protein [Sphingomonas donggukensis]URW76315.1 hypothetical protein M9980_03580 [Sphingomonas donggukensis]
MKNSRKASVLTAVAGATLLAACVGPTPYRPATGQGFNRTGFTDQQIERDRYRVTFAGNSYTDRETVERYLLFRAAELTLSQGADYFVLADRDIDKQTRTYTSPGLGGFGGPYGGLNGFGYWGPSWRYYGRGYGWRGWNAWGGDPFWDRSVDITTVERYEASAEIVVGRGPKPAGNLRAFNARDVVDRLGPTIRVPEQRR